MAALQEPIAERIVEALATTPAGHAARPRAVMFWQPEPVGPGPGDVGQRLLHALLRNLARSDAVAEARGELSTRSEGSE